MKKVVLALEGGASYLTQGVRWCARKQPFTESEVYAVAFIIVLVAAVTAAV